MDGRLVAAALSLSAHTQPQVTMSPFLFPSPSPNAELLYLSQPRVARAGNEPGQAASAAKLIARTATMAQFDQFDRFDRTRATSCAARSPGRDAGLAALGPPQHLRGGVACWLGRHGASAGARGGRVMLCGAGAVVLVCHQLHDLKHHASLGGCLPATARQSRPCPFGPQFFHHSASFSS